jgi:hypothetical protein
MNHSNQLLDIFGQFLMEKVRDETIEHWEKVTKGSMNDTESKEIFKSLSTFTPEQSTPEQMKLIRSLLPGIVDTTLHYLLWSMEENENINWVVEFKESEVNIAEISDGLAGELYYEDGWKHRFSKFK